MPKNVVETEGPQMTSQYGAYEVVVKIICAFERI
jgi:hypothetical protein